MNPMGWFASALAVVGILFLVAALAVMNAEGGITVTVIGLLVIGTALVGLGVLIILLLILTGQDPLVRLAKEKLGL